MVLEIINNFIFSLFITDWRQTVLLFHTKKMFLKFIFEPNQLFFQIRIENS